MTDDTYTEIFLRQTYIIANGLLGEYFNTLVAKFENTLKQRQNSTRFNHLVWGCLIDMNSDMTHYFVEHGIPMDTLGYIAQLVMMTGHIPQVNHRLAYIFINISEFKYEQSNAVSFMEDYPITEPLQ